MTQRRKTEIIIIIIIRKLKVNAAYLSSLVQGKPVSEAPSFDGQRCLSEQAVETGRRRTSEATEQGCTVGLLEYRISDASQTVVATVRCLLFLSAVCWNYCLLRNRVLLFSVQKFVFLIGGPGPHKQPGGVRKNIKKNKGRSL